ncbi:N-acetyltransferase family protein [Jatrophihabitans sp. YIM 134969]
MIRTLHPDDLDLVRDLRRALHDHHAALPPVPGYRVREFAVAWEGWHAGARRVLTEGRGVVFVHDDGGAPDGMAYLYELDPADLVRPIVEPTGPHIELSTLVGAAHARGRGIGSALQGAGEEWARERGAVALHIRVRASNTDATRLYERRGAHPAFGSLVQPL